MLKHYVDSSQVDRLHEQTFQCCKLLQEQFDYLQHLSVDELQSNLILYEKIKDLNSRLRIQTYTVLKGLRLIIQV